MKMKKRAIFNIHKFAKNKESNNIVVNRAWRKGY